MCLETAALVIMNEQQIYLFGQSQTSQTGGQLYSDTSASKVRCYHFQNCKDEYIQEMLFVFYLVLSCQHLNI